MEKWRSALRRRDWYIDLENELNGLLKTEMLLEVDKSDIYRLVSEMLKDNAIPLATIGPDFDKDRDNIDTIIIHHSGLIRTDANLLSAIGFVRQYGWDYLHKQTFGHNLYGKAIWSGHFMGSKQTFSAYHWLIYPNGKAQRLLKDNYIGWHAGNWDINCRSIGIVLSGDFLQSPPTSEQIESLQTLIGLYSHIQKQNVLLHSDVVDTLCPGEKFISKWREVLRKM